MSMAAYSHGLPLLTHDPVDIMSDPLCVQAISPDANPDDSLVDKVDIDSTTKYPTYMLVLMCVSVFEFPAVNSDA